MCLKEHSDQNLLICKPLYRKNQNHLKAPEEYLVEHHDKLSERVRDVFRYVDDYLEEHNFKDNEPKPFWMFHVPMQCHAYSVTGGTCLDFLGSIIACLGSPESDKDYARIQPK